MITRVADLTCRFASAFVGILLAVLTVLVGASVFWRYVLNDSITWAQDLSIYLLVYLTMFGAAVGLRRGEMVAFDLVLRRLRPGTARWFWLLGQVAIIRVGAASVCGSDLHLYHHIPAFAHVPVPRVMGHECAGTVTAVGPGADGSWVGQRVIAETFRYCGDCDQCRRGRQNTCERYTVTGFQHDGCFAEYLACPARLLHRIPAGLPDPVATWAEPLSVAVHAVYARSSVQPGDVVLVTGPGPVGLLIAQVARHAGGKPVVAGAAADAAVRLPAAEGLAIPTINVAMEEPAAGLRRLFDRTDADVCFECSGSAGVPGRLLALTRRGGHINVVAMFQAESSIDFSLAVRRELTLMTTQGSVAADYDRALALLAADSVAVVPLSGLFPLGGAVAAFHAAEQQRVVKPVLIPRG